VLRSAEEKLTFAQDTIDEALDTFRGRIALACSFGGPSGLAILDMVVARDKTVPVFFLDTGLLFPETYALVERVRERYGIEPVAVKPAHTVEQQAAEHGPALWTRDPDRCCALRKVEPHRLFLSGYDAWFTGIRRDQSDTRAAAEFVERDEDGRARIAPLADWTEAEVWQYIAVNDVPYNELAERGFGSIGCAPCTRPVAPGEHSRAGRWAGFVKTECGIQLEASA